MCTRERDRERERERERKTERVPFWNCSVLPYDYRVCVEGCCCWTKLDLFVMTALYTTTFG